MDDQRPFGDWYLDDNGTSVYDPSLTSRLYHQIARANRAVGDQIPIEREKLALLIIANGTDPAEAYAAQGLTKLYEERMSAKE